MRHSNPTLQFGAVHFFNEPRATLWIANLDISLFGCYEKCTFCDEDNKPDRCFGCVDGYYLDGSTCKACNSPCFTCEGSASNCKSCNSDKYLELGGCVILCSIGQYSDKYGACKTCPEECNQCTSATKCSACKNEHFLKNNTCIPCDQNCVNCFDKAEYCISCPAGKYLQTDSSSNSTTSTCVSNCSIGFFQQGEICSACSSDNSCMSCTGPICDTCALGGYIKNDQQRCTLCNNDNGYFKNILTNTCDLCGVGCKTCSGSQNNC